MNSNDTFKAMVWNTHGSTDAAHWTKVCKFIDSCGVDLALLQEVRGGRGFEDRVGQAADVLGSCVVAPNAGPRHNTAVASSNRIFHPVGEDDAYEHDMMWKISPTDVTLRPVAYPDSSLTVVSVHMAFNAPTRRRLEAEDISGLADKIKNGVKLLVGGDFNELPTSDEHPYGDISDGAHRVHRAERNGRGGWTPLDYVDYVITESGMVDVARAVTERDLGELRPTAGHHPDIIATQGGPIRIDRQYASPGITEHLVAVDTIDVDPELSDHAAVVATYATAALA